MKLEGTPTQLQLVDIPRDSVLRVDGKEMMYAKKPLVAVSEGIHHISIEHPCYEYTQLDVEIRAGETLPLNISPKPLMKNIYIPSKYKFPVMVKGKVYGYTGSEVAIPSCASFVHYGKKTAKISKFEIRD